MPRLPQVSGRDLAALLENLFYRFMRQRGSHARYSLTAKVGTHNVTLPMHDVMAKGTLSDILSRVSLWTARSREELLAML